MKIAVIGGGSTYTPELIEGFIEKSAALGLSELALMDIDDERLEVVGGFAQRMVAHAGNPFRVTLTKNRTAALEGASFVSTQFRVGKQAARHQDILLGLRHNLIGQETTGIGGMAKALRTLPIIFDICEEMDRVCPDAWLINFTNPSGLVTEAIVNYAGREKCIGLCNVPIEMKMTVAKHLGVPESEVDMDVVGLNHLGWVRKITVRGEDITASLLDFLSSEEGPKNIPDMDFEPELIRALGAVPLYYDRFYYNTERVLEHLKSKPKTRAQEVEEIEEKLLAKYRDPNQVTKPEELNERGGAYYSKIAIEVMDAIVNDLGLQHAVNVRNQGAIPGIPDQYVVETICTITKDGAEPRRTWEVDESMLALIMRAKYYEVLTIEAARDKSYHTALKAIFTNPVGPSADRAKAVLDDLLATNKLEYR
ncbi:MAG: 6-phospho-beta-glucosidase [Candidatus Lernaella stagnicola]|nr:6-phospho-beta-glucosidase [Candidatus Lernaella stagnicola]